ncbi:MAG TPA: site-specific integrase [Vicinamibacterales bacterium]|nr:site-specific integrase [Vicinamibacterales bacterium]
MARKIREQILSREFNLSATDSTTFETYARKWLKDGEATRKASTHRFYRFNLELHTFPIIGTQAIHSLGRSDCRRLVASCRDKGLKVASVQGVQRTLSAVLSQAVEDELLAANPALRMGRHVRQGDEPKREIAPLSKDEVQRFLSAVESDWPEHYAFFLCAVRTGMRLGELLALQWGDFDLKKGFVRIQRNLVAGRLTTPKNGTSRRVDLSKQLIETLERRLVAAKAEKLRSGKEELNPWVFANSEGKPLDGDNLRRRVFQKALTRAKLRQIRLHDLRHTYASLLLAQGVAPLYVKDQLGHSSIKVTVDIYGHLFPGSNRDTVDKLDDSAVCIPAASESETATTKDGRK